MSNRGIIIVIIRRGKREEEVGVKEKKINRKKLRNKRQELVNEIEKDGKRKINQKYDFNDYGVKRMVLKISMKIERRGK